jgi:hypothetical protein
LASDPLARIKRESIARRRLNRILESHVVANDRILEQKISDAGPGPQRINPHILTPVRKEMSSEGLISVLPAAGVPWYHLTSVSETAVSVRLNELAPIHARTTNAAFANRLGQVLEIAIFRALQQQTSLGFMGGFRGLDKHDDRKPYSKSEPPSMLSGRDIGPKNLDFIVTSADGDHAGIEAKNIRQWMYPDRTEIRDLLWKCCVLDVVPVLIARRIHYSTFSVLHPCGVILHQMFTQLYPATEADLAAAVRHKGSLGYHDVRVGNEPDARLLKFIGTNLPKLISPAREKFNIYKDLLFGFATEEHKYASFAARVKRRMRGEPEDGFPEEPDADYYDGDDVPEPDDPDSHDS